MPALQVVLPWLLLLNQAITETSVVFTQGQGLPSSQSCSPSEYLIAGRCCKACPADEEVLEECTPTHDRVCQCRSGYFYAHVGCSEICSLCSTCPTGHVVVRRCNATADTVCCLPAPQRRHRCSLLGSCLGFVLVVMCLNFWVTKRAGFPDGDPECVEMVTVVPGRGRASSISPSSVKLPQNSVSSMPSNQDRSAESSVPMRGNPNQPEDSVDIPTEAPAVTRALHSL
ncbi:tumor necrosis factor receptor superfamily member 22-like isoform X1 [Odocoileus virginianus]|uniref:Tumor necrosis factor receptor superfamily member 22-like isoform X1 n=1 Tax=Odocoileus virginianus TaxID=9874 RepID=A0ABM4HED3_ODOVR